MTVKTPITDLATKLLSAGTSRDVTLDTIRSLEIALNTAAAETTKSRDVLAATLNRKREIDADRQRKKRANAVKTTPDLSRDTDSYRESLLSLNRKDSQLEGKKEDSIGHVTTRAKTEVLSDWPPDYREQFWQTYPPDRRVEKKAALAKLDGIRKTGLAWKVLIEGVQRYAAKCQREGTAPRYIKHPLVWLNKGCWDDAVSKNHEGNSNGQSTFNLGPGGARANGADNFLAGMAEVARRRGGNGPVAGRTPTNIPAGRFEIDAEPAE